MPLERKDNQKRMEKNRAADKKENKREERDAIINGVVAKLSEKLPDMLRTMVSAEVQFNQMSGQRKLSCREEAAHPAQLTPPRAIRTGGTRGRSPAMGSGNGRKKATKQQAPSPPSPPTPPTPPTPLPPLPLLTPSLLTPSRLTPSPLFTPPRTPPVPLSPLSPLSLLSELKWSTPGAELSTAKKLVSELIDLVDDVHKIFQFPTEEEEDFTAEKKRYHK